MYPIKHILPCFYNPYPSDGSIRSFPSKFLFGVSTSSYQIEGAWNEDGKGESIWDNFTHITPSIIEDKSNGDIACDSYRLYERDIEMMKELGVHYYRFSISWTRIAPTGNTDDGINQQGVDYYNKLIDKLLEKSITPLVTIFHWDLPQKLEDLGGWRHSSLPIIYERYVDNIFRLFGDRVKKWITFNEPRKFCYDGYGHKLGAPGLDSISGFGEYECGHNILRAHAKAYHLYQDKYKSEQGGKIGISLDSSWFLPASDSEGDKKATDRCFAFELDRFAHPIYSEEGGYPQLLIDRVGEQSKEQGYRRSRLPEFTEEEKASLRKSADFFGFNHYDTVKCKEKDASSSVSYDDDMGCTTFSDESWPAFNNLMRTVPWGFRNILNYIKDKYNNPEVLITENGYATNSGIEDNDRIKHTNQYLNALLDAIEDGGNISGYTMWSLMDNFEWINGYAFRFGLYEVDFEDPHRLRIPRKSAAYFTNLIAKKVVETDT